MRAGSTSHEHIRQSEDPAEVLPVPESPPFFFLISHLKNAAPAVSLGSSKCYLEIWVLAPDFCLCENRAGESVSLSDVREWERVWSVGVCDCVDSSFCKQVHESEKEYRVQGRGGCALHLNL